MKMKIIMSYIIEYIFLILLIFFLPSCTNENKSNNKIVKLNEVTRSVFYAPQYIALELGYFKKFGLDVRLNSAEGSDKTMTAILSNQADIGLLGASAVISVYSQGKEEFPVLFSQLTQRDGSFLVGREKYFNWNDLKGKEIIAGRRGGVPEMVLEYILKKKGFNLKEDLVLLNNIKFDLMGIAFSRGVGDYVCLFEPTASMFEKESSMYILEPLGLQCEKICYTCYCTSQKYIKENPETIEAFTKAIYEAQKWIKNNDARKIAEMVLPYFIDCSLDLLTKCIENYINSEVWCENPVIDENGFNLLEEIMIEAGELESKVDFNKVVDNKFAMYAIE